MASALISSSCCSTLPSRLQPVPRRLFHHTPRASVHAPPRTPPLDSLFRLEITVHNVVTVAVLDGGNHLLEEAAGLVLVHAALALCDNVVEQLFARILHDHDDVCGRRDDLVPVACQRGTVEIE